jgi:hypothetical protein
MNESLIVFAAVLLTLNDVLFTVQDITQSQKFIVIVISHVINHIFCAVVCPSENPILFCSYSSLEYLNPYEPFFIHQNHFHAQYQDVG